MTHIRHYLLIATFCLVGLLLPVMAIAQAPAPTYRCDNTAAIPDPESADLIHDCEILLYAKDTLRGSASLNWSTATLITTWDGVGRVSNSRVIWLDFGCNNEETCNQLTGIIPWELGHLFALKHLTLSGNNLTGPIPPELGKLTNLETLTLDNNKLTGTIPPTWAISTS